MMSAIVNKLLLILSVFLLSCCNKFKTKNTVIQVELCAKSQKEFKGQTQFLVYNYSGDTYHLDSIARKFVCSNLVILEKQSDKHLVSFYKKTRKTTLERLECRSKPIFHNVENDRISQYVFNVSTPDILVVSSGDIVQKNFKKREILSSCNDD